MIMADALNDEIIDKTTKLERAESARLAASATVAALEDSIRVL